MKLVADTNIILSGIFYRGNPFLILSMILKGEIRLILTEEILEEYTRVCLKTDLLENTLIKKEHVKAVLEEIKKVAENVTPSEYYRKIHKDPSDDKFLNAAAEGDAKYIVSSDIKHLLKLKKFKDTEIVTATEFIRKYSAIKRKREDLMNAFIISPPEKEHESKYYFIESKKTSESLEKSTKQLSSYLKFLLERFRSQKKK